MGAKRHRDQAPVRPGQAARRQPERNSVIKLTRILKDYQESGALSALIDVHAAVDDQTFLTKSGRLIMFLAFTGPDHECLDAPQLDQIARRFEGALRLLGEDFRLYQYLVKRDNPAIPARTYEHPVVQEAVAGRMAYLSDRCHSLCSLETYFAVVYEGWKTNPSVREKLSGLLKAPITRLREALSPREKISALEEELAHAREILSQPEAWIEAGARAAKADGALPPAGARVVVLGCGTSYYMAQAYAAIREVGGRGETDAAVASETDGVRAYDVAVAISRSGTTTEVLRALLGEEAAGRERSALTTRRAAAGVVGRHRRRDRLRAAR